MIQWSFVVDSWEHPFNRWSRRPSPDSGMIISAIRPKNLRVRFTPGPKVPGEPKPDVAEPTPKKKTGRTTSWDWSKFNIPLFENGFTRTRLPQPPGPVVYSDEQLSLRQWMEDRGYVTTGAPPVVKVGWWAMFQMTYATGGADLYSEDIATYEDSALVGGGGMVI